MEVLLVLLIVALLNGAIAYINDLLTGIVPMNSVCGAVHDHRVRLQYRGYAF